MFNHLKVHLPPLSLLALIAMVTATASLLSISPSYAGGWTQEKGSYYLKAASYSVVGSKGNTAEADVIPVGDFKDIALGLYGEYGVNNNMTVLFSSRPIGYASGPLGKTTYMGPLVAGLRYGMKFASWHLALEGHYGYESGIGGKSVLVKDFTDSKGVVQQAIYLPSIKNHSGELQFQGGHALSFGWVSFAAGFKTNSNTSVDNAIVANVQLGWKKSDHMTLSWSTQTYQPLGEVVATNVSGVGQTRYIGMTFGLAYKLSEKIDFIAELGAAVPGYLSNAATPSLGIGIAVH